MKLLLVASEIPPTPGGIATYVGNTVAMFADAGHEITVFARSDRPGIEQQDTYTLIRIVPKDIHLLSATPTDPLSEKHPAFPYNVMGYWGALSYQLAEAVLDYIRKHGKPDAIESEDFSGLAYFLIQKKLVGCPELDGVPIILTLHSSQYMLYPADCMPSYRLSDYWVGRMEKFCTLAADGIIAPTQYIAKSAIAAVGNSLDLEIIPLPASKSLLNPHQLPSSQPTPGDIIYFGRLEVRKGVIPLVEACSKLWQDGHSFQLTLIGGDTWYHLQGCHLSDYLKHKYRHYIDAEQLILSPPLPQLQLHQRIARAWCVVLPSLWENFPNSCMESMLLGKAILASDDVGHVEMLRAEEEEAGIIFDWNLTEDFSEKLLHLLSLNREQILQMGASARNFVRETTRPEVVLVQRLKHLQRVIEKSRQQTQTFFPSLNYPPSGHIAYPQPLVDSQSIPRRVSVCVPFYNHGRYIQETLFSVYASDYPNLEVIVFDDGSNDPKSLEMLNALEKQYSDLKVIRAENSGVAAARNHLAQVAGGEYLAFLDADDKVSPTFYSQAVQILSRYENVGFVASWLKEFGESQKVWIAWNPEFPYLLCHNLLGVCTVVRKTAYLAAGGMNPLLAENLEDYECWINLCERGWVGVVIPELHYFYRIRSDSRLQRSHRNQLLYLYEKIAQLHPILYQKYGTDIYHLLNQNGASWLWDNPSRSQGGVYGDLTGMEVLRLFNQKLKKMRNDGGIRLILRKLFLVLKLLIFSRFRNS
ncbi:MAG: glycosyltransferase [Cyanobacteriota bacterium]|nr:glycosyltransferase [Cyanobacteriota bacterium]